METEQLSFDFGDGGDVDLDDLLTAEEKAAIEAEEGKKTPVVPNGEGDASKKANELLAKQIADQQKLIEDLQTKVRTSSFDTSLQHTPAPVAQPQVDLAKLKGELANLMMSDPGEFAIRLFNAGQEAAKAEVERRTSPLATSGAAFEINAYRTEKTKSDPDVDAEFASLTSQPGVAASLANNSPEQRRAALDLLYDAATGRASRKKGTETKRDRTPPSYGGGQGFSTGTEVTSNYKGKPLNAVQREIMRAAHDSGIKDPKRIKAMLDDAAEG